MVGWDLEDAVDLEDLADLADLEDLERVGVSSGSLYAAAWALGRITEAMWAVIVGWQATMGDSGRGGS